VDKLIREGRFGPPKTFKTGSVVGTYPRPLLLLNCDEEGPSIFPHKGEKVTSTFIPFEIFYEDLFFVKPDGFTDLCKKSPSDLPLVTVLDVVDMVKQRLMTTNYVPIANDAPLKNFVDSVNKLILVGCPWKTIVVDSVTGLSEIVLSHVASVNQASLADPRKWAPMAGGKVAQMIGVLSSTPAHFVCIFHESYRENEASQEVRIAPLVHSQVRDRIGGMFSQWFYQFKENGKPKIRSTDFGLAKGVGCRWPLGLDAVSDPTFKAIYGNVIP
jgi:hypothetical protein